MSINIENLTHKYNDFVSLKNINLEIKEGELIALLGPSGCGKTTLLKAIAGLTDVYSGKIFLGDKDITQLSPQKRETALVFQNYALFPHMSVEENIEYGLKVKEVKKEDRKRKIEHVLEIVKLEGYGRRKIHELSGGQQQRVALARALVIEPEVLLFDEPLSNLDEKLRVNMREEIRRIQKELGITSVYVTHDQEEAMAIADRIAVMEAGVIHQIAPSQQAYSQPNNEFVARFMGEVNMIPYEFIRKDGEMTKLNVFNTEIDFPVNRDISLGLENAKSRLSLMIRPENIEITEGDGFEGILKWVEYLGSIIRYTVSVESYEIKVLEINHRTQPLMEGDKVRIGINWNKALLLNS